MDQIDALERRIAAALDRIGGALAHPDQGAKLLARLESEWATARAEEELARGEAQRLAEALEDERLVTGQIRARNEALHEKLAAFEAGADGLAETAAAQAAGLETARAEIARLRADLLQREALAAQLRRVNMQLRQNNLQLREAVQKGMGDPHLINKAMLTELESIRLSREAERAEIDGVLAELRALTGQAPAAPLAGAAGEPQPAEAREAGAAAGADAGLPASRDPGGDAGQSKDAGPGIAGTSLSGTSGGGIGGVGVSARDMSAGSPAAAIPGAGFTEGDGTEAPVTEAPLAETPVTEAFVTEPGGTETPVTEERVTAAGFADIGDVGPGEGLASGAPEGAEAGVKSPGPATWSGRPEPSDALPAAAEGDPAAGLTDQNIAGAAPTGAGAANAAPLAMEDRNA